MVIRTAHVLNVIQIDFPISDAERCQQNILSHHGPSLEAVADFQASALNSYQEALGNMCR